MKNFGGTLSWTNVYITVLLFLFVSANAQTADIHVTQQHIRPLKSEKTGVWWSLGTTAATCGLGALCVWQIQEEVGWGMIAGGLIVGPSMGHLYANQWGRGCVGIGSRVLVGGITAYWLCAISSIDSEDLSGAAFIGLAGCATTLGLILWDISEVPHSVRKHNMAVEKSNSIDLQPMIGKDRCGLMVVYRF